MSDTIKAAYIIAGAIVVAGFMSGGVYTPAGGTGGVLAVNKFTGAKFDSFYRP